MDSRLSATVHTCQRGSPPLPQNECLFLIAGGAFPLDGRALPSVTAPLRQGAASLRPAATLLRPMTTALCRMATPLRYVTAALSVGATVLCGPGSSSRAGEILLLRGAGGLRKIGASSHDLNLS